MLPMLHTLVKEVVQFGYTMWDVEELIVTQSCTCKGLQLSTHLLPQSPVSPLPLLWVVHSSTHKYIAQAVQLVLLISNIPSHCSQGYLFTVRVSMCGATFRVHYML